MSVQITAIFGVGISVSWQPRKPLRQFSSFAGAHGATAMLMGSDGYPVTIMGTLKTNGGMTYAAARKTMVQAIENIETWNWAQPVALTYGNETYYNCVLEKFNLIDSDGKAFKYVAGGHCVCRFIAVFRSLL